MRGVTVRPFGDSAEVRADVAEGAQVHMLDLRVEVDTEGCERHRQLRTQDKLCDNGPFPPKSNRDGSMA